MDDNAREFQSAKCCLYSRVSTSILGSQIGNAAGKNGLYRNGNRHDVAAPLPWPSLSETTILPSIAPQRKTANAREFQGAENCFIRVHWRPFAVPNLTSINDTANQNSTGFYAD